LGVEILRIIGDEATGKCPGHVARLGKQDRHPSWSVNLDSGVHNCFSCGFAGPFVTIVQEVLGCDRLTAVEWVRARGGIERVRAILNKNKVSAADLADTTKQMNEASLALFVDPPDKQLTKRKMTLRAARHYGVLWDADAKMWILPIREPETGKLRGWQEKAPGHFKNYPFNMEKKDCLFGYEWLADQGLAILVESPLDVPRMYASGIEGAVASYGAKVSDEQLDLIAAKTDRLIVALDNPYIDPEGSEQAEKILVRAAGRFRLWFLNYEGLDAKDPGEMSDEQLAGAIRTSIKSSYVRGGKRRERSVRALRDRS
jgi:hypothetical protein